MCLYAQHGTVLRYLSSSSAAAAATLQPLVGLGFLFLIPHGLFCVAVVTIYSLWGEVLSPTPNPRPGGPGYPFLSVITFDLSGMEGPTSRPSGLLGRPTLQYQTFS